MASIEACAEECDTADCSAFNFKPSTLECSLWAKDALSAYGGDRGVFHGPTHGAYGVECFLNTARNYIWTEYTETKCVRESDSGINADLKTFT